METENQTLLHTGPTSAINTTDGGPSTPRESRRSKILARFRSLVGKAYQFFGPARNSTPSIRECQAPCCRRPDRNRTRKDQKALSTMSRVAAIHTKMAENEAAEFNWASASETQVDASEITELSVLLRNLKELERRHALSLQSVDNMNRELQAHSGRVRKFMKKLEADGLNSGDRSQYLSQRHSSTFCSCQMEGCPQREDYLQALRHSHQKQDPMEILQHSQQQIQKFYQTRGREHQQHHDHSQQSNDQSGRNIFSVDRETINANICSPPTYFSSSNTRSLPNFDELLDQRPQSPLPLPFPQRQQQQADYANMRPDPETFLRSQPVFYTSPTMRSVISGSVTGSRAVSASASASVSVPGYWVSPAGVRTSVNGVSTHSLARGFPMF